MRKHKIKYTKKNTTQLLLLVARIESASSLEQRREAAEELSHAVEKKPAWAGPDSITYCFTPAHINSLKQVLQDHPEEYDIVAYVLEILLAATALPNGATGWTEIAQGDQSSNRQNARNFLNSNNNPKDKNNNNNGQQQQNFNRNPEQQKAHAVELISVLVEDTQYLLELLMRNRPSPTTTSNDPDLSQTVRDKVPFWVQYNAMQLLARLHAADNTSFGKTLLACDGIPVLLEILNDSSNNGVLRDECLVLLQDITLLPANHELQTILAFNNCFEALFTVIRDEGGILSGSVVVRECITVMHNIVRSNHAAQRLFREMGSLNQLSALLNTDVFANTSTIGSPGRFGTTGVDSEAQAQGATVPPAAAETYSTVGALISTLIRSGDSNGEGTSVRQSCVNANLPSALVRAVFESLQVANGSYETEENQLLTTLALAVQGSREGVHVVINATVRQFGIDSVSVAWLLMRMALSDEPQRCSAAAQILSTAIAVGSPEIVAPKILLEGLESSKTTGSAPMLSGYVLRALIMAPKPPTPTTWHVAGHLLANCILSHPDVAERAAKVPAAIGNNNNSIPTSFFQAYVTRTRRILEARQTDIATNVACLYPILVWIRVCPQTCAAAFASDPATPLFFAEWALACRDAASHVPFLCAAIVCLCALMYTGPDLSDDGSSQQQHSNNNRSSISREQLMKLVTDTLTLKRLETLKNGVVASDDWNRATRVPALNSLPSVVMYDQTFCGILNEITGAFLSAPQPPPPERISEKQQQQQQQVVIQEQQQQHQVDDVFTAVTNQQQQHINNNNSNEVDPFFAVVEDNGGGGYGNSEQDPYNNNENNAANAFYQDDQHQQQQQQSEFQYGNHQTQQQQQQQQQDPFASDDQQQHEYEYQNEQQHHLNALENTQQHQVADTEILRPPSPPKAQQIYQQQQHEQYHHQFEQYQQQQQQQAQQQSQQQVIEQQQQQAQQNQQLIEQLQDANYKVSSAEDKIRHLEQQLRDSQLANDALQNQLEAANSKNTTLQKQNDALQKQLSQSQEQNQTLKAEKESLQREFNNHKQSSATQIQHLERQKQEVQHQFQQSYDLLQRRNEDLQNAEKRIKMAEMKLIDVSKDKNELLMLVGEMERQYFLVASSEHKTSVELEQEIEADERTEKQEALLYHQHPVTAAAFVAAPVMMSSNNTAGADYNPRSNQDGLDSSYPDIPLHTLPQQQQQKYQNKKVITTAAEVQKQKSAQNSRPISPIKEQQQLELEPESQNEYNNGNYSNVEDDPFAIDDGNNQNNNDNEYGYYGGGTQHQQLENNDNLMNAIDNSFATPLNHVQQQHQQQESTENNNFSQENGFVTCANNNDDPFADNNTNINNNNNDVFEQQQQEYSSEQQRQQQETYYDYKYNNNESNAYDPFASSQNPDEEEQQQKQQKQQSEEQQHDNDESPPQYQHQYQNNANAVDDPFLSGGGGGGFDEDIR